MTVRRHLRRGKCLKMAALHRKPPHPSLHRRQLGAHPRDRLVDTAAVGEERRAAVAEGGHLRVDAAERRHPVVDGGRAKMGGDEAQGGVKGRGGGAGCHEELDRGNA